MAASAFSTRLVALLTAPGCRERRPLTHRSTSLVRLIEFELELGIDHIQEGFEIGASRLDIQAVAIADSTDAFRNCSVISMSKPNDFGARNDDQVREVGDDSDQVREQISDQQLLFRIDRLNLRGEELRSGSQTKTFH